MDIERSEISEIEFIIPGITRIQFNGPIFLENPSELEELFRELNVDISKIESLFCEDEAKRKLYNFFHNSFLFKNNKTLLVTVRDFPFQIK